MPIRPAFLPEEAAAPTFGTDDSPTARSTCHFGAAPSSSDHQLPISPFVTHHTKPGTDVSTFFTDVAATETLQPPFSTET